MLSYPLFQYPFVSDTKYALPVNVCLILYYLFQKKDASSSDRPVSAAHVSFSESSSSQGRHSYHSEPLRNTYSILEQETIELLRKSSGSEPNMSPKESHPSPKHDIYINVKRTEAYYIRYDPSIGYRTRNI